MFLNIFRPDVLWLLPAVAIALIQAKFIWGKLPETNPQETAIPGKYDDLDQFGLSYVTIFVTFLFILQLITPLWNISSDQTVILVMRVLGYILIVGGFVISLKALKDLGNNWTGMNEYRIKKDQQLITNGIYNKIRHPIYLAVLMETLGYELIANSWLLVPILVIGTVIFIRHINLEEKLLREAFGEKFTNYSQKTKKLIPYIY